jgi:hypothetical protein
VKQAPGGHSVPSQSPFWASDLAKAYGTWQAESKFQPKLMLFAVTAPYQLMLNHFMSSIWVQ